MAATQQQQHLEPVKLACPYCDGSGHIQLRSRWDNPYWVGCSNCAGLGYVLAEQQPGPRAAA